VQTTFHLISTLNKESEKSNHSAVYDVSAVKPEKRFFNETSLATGLHKKAVQDAY